MEVILLLELEEDGAGGTSGNTNSSGSGFSCGAGEYTKGNGGMNGDSLRQNQINTSIGGSYFETFNGTGYTMNKTVCYGAVGGIRRWRIWKH